MVLTNCYIHSLLCQFGCCRLSNTCHKSMPYTTYKVTRLYALCSLLHTSSPKAPSQEYLNNYNPKLYCLLFFLIVFFRMIIKTVHLNCSICWRGYCSQMMLLSELIAHWVFQRSGVLVSIPVLPPVMMTCRWLEAAEEDWADLHTEYRLLFDLCKSKLNATDFKIMGLFSS